MDSGGVSVAFGMAILRIIGAELDCFSTKSATYRALSCENSAALGGFGEEYIAKPPNYIWPNDRKGISQTPTKQNAVIEIVSTTALDLVAGEGLEPSTSGL